ncbi:hypothetical protein CF326_g2111 [Tilletia indica]|nr:hypothetical protein CF326_g2111 [Tilletia indica]
MDRVTLSNDQLVVLLRLAASFSTASTNSTMGELFETSSQPVNNAELLQFFASLDASTANTFPSASPTTATASTPPVPTQHHIQHAHSTSDDDIQQFLATLPSFPTTPAPSTPPGQVTHMPQQTVPPTCPGSTSPEQMRQGFHRTDDRATISRQPTMPIQGTSIGTEYSTSHGDDHDERIGSRGPGPSNNGAATSSRVPERRSTRIKSRPSTQRQQHNNFFDLSVLNAPSDPRPLPQLTSNPPQVPLFSANLVRYRSVVKILRPFNIGIPLRELWKTINSHSSTDDDPAVREDLASIAHEFRGRARARQICIQMSSVVRFEALMVKPHLAVGNHYGIRISGREVFYTHEQPPIHWNGRTDRFEGFPSE